MSKASRSQDSGDRKSLENDSKLNAKFDSISKLAAAPKKKRVMRLEKRRRGRPKAGRIVFHQVRIDTLPKIAHLSEVARKLGIKHTTLQQWCSLKTHPLPFVDDGGHKLFRKDILVKWLIATKRFTKKPEYEEALDEDAAAN